MNGFQDRVKIVPALVSALGDVSYDGWNVQEGKGKKPMNFTYTKETVSLDSFVNRPVLYMKVDVEGWEPSVFASAKKTFRQFRPRFMYFEVTYHLYGWRYDYIQLAVFLGGHGYVCFHPGYFPGPVAISSEAVARKWFSILQSRCNQTLVHYCQVEAYCWHGTEGSVPVSVSKRISDWNYVLKEG